MSMASLIEVKRNPNIPDLAPGDTVKVSSKVVESGRERTQSFQGVVIKVQRGGVNANFTVRRVAYSVGVERTFSLYSPLVEKVEIIRHGKVRRAKLYYLRGRSGKAARIKERRVARKKKAVQAEPEPEPVEAQNELVQDEPEATQAQEEVVPAQEEPKAVQAEPEPEPVEAQNELVQDEPEATQAQEEVVPAQEEPEDKPE